MRTLSDWKWNTPPFGPENVVGRDVKAEPARKPQIEARKLTRFRWTAPRRMAKIPFVQVLAIL
jgi:hypothetical protein